MRARLINRFLQQESASGIILFLAAILAVIWANSPLAYIHQRFVTFSLFWVNEGLMAAFFLIVGLELKRNYLSQQLSPLSKVMLPAFAAIGGMLIPALFYALINYDNALALRGSAIPVATDIAFALGVLSLFGKRIPVALKLFLMVLAIFDDIGAIIIIALFYSHDLAVFWLFLSAVSLLVLCLFNQLLIRSMSLYLLAGVGLWFCLYFAGIRPTIAGVMLSLTIPADRDEKKSSLHMLETRLHPWVAYFIMPLFALANAGFSLHGISLETFTHTVVLGIMCGLFFGKQIGVFGFAWLLIRLRFAKLPDAITWPMLYGTTLLCGIGFTMSLFLGTLSFQNESDLYLREVRLGVIMGSIFSALAGAAVLLLSKKKQFLSMRSQIID